MNVPLAECCAVISFSVLMMSVFVCHAAVTQQAHLIWIVQAAASTLKSHVEIGFESDSKSHQEVV